MEFNFPKNIGDVPWPEGRTKASPEKLKSFTEEAKKVLNGTQIDSETETLFSRFRSDYFNNEGELKEELTNSQLLQARTVLGYLRQHRP